MIQIIYSEHEKNKVRKYYPLLKKGGGSLTYNVSEDYHIFLVGATRKGKTTLEKMILNTIAMKNHFLKNEDKVRLVVGDPKGDWSLEIKNGAKNVYQFEKSFEAINVVFEEFERRLKCEDRNYPYLILVFDELNSYLESITDKKIFKDVQMKIRRLVYQSAAFKIRIFLIAQSLYAAAVGGADFKNQFDVIIALSINSQINYELFEWGDEKIDRILNSGFAVYQRAGENAQICKIKRVTKEMLESISKSLANFSGN